MTDLEIEFLEAYKDIEKILNDAYYTRHGVTAYIDRMRDDRYGWNCIQGWERDFKSLKRVRGIRNFLTHETGISDCDEDDLDYLYEFYDRLMDFDDPIARLNKARQQTKKVVTSNKPSNNDTARNPLPVDNRYQNNYDSRGFALNLLLFIVGIFAFIYIVYRLLFG